MNAQTIPPTPAALLRAAGIKVTQPRLRVLGALRAATRPMSHAELEALLGDVDRVTLYRILDTLADHGLATKATDVRGVFRFSATDMPRPHDDHVHFRCSRCGGVFCLKAAPPPPPRLPRGFRLEEADFDLRGVCAKCSGRTS
ncbi:MAG: transcriptional repressor [Rhodocyclaceae bacterium]|jgi:Fur family ferric uptake transcriptional regulator|nr:transcriptional repressor [Rhodocyclaceae bacterium]